MQLANLLSGQEVKGQGSVIYRFRACAPEQIIVTRNSALAHTARVTMTSVIAVDRLILTVTLNMLCNFFSH